MPTIEMLFQDALSDEPPARDLVMLSIARARRRARRRHLTATATVFAAAACGVGMLAIGSVGRSNDRSRDAVQAQTIAQFQHSARAAQRTGLDATSFAVADPRMATRLTSVTAASLPGLVERLAGIQLSDVSVTSSHGGSLGLFGAVRTVGGKPAGLQEMSVLVAAKHELETVMPSCAALESSAGGDAHSGPCQVSALPGGGYLVVRSGTTAHGGYGITAADLVRSDGSGVLVETSNQRYQELPQRVPGTGGTGGTPLYVVGPPPPVVSTLPPVPATRLAALAQTLARLA